MKKYVLGSLMIVFIIIQFIQPERNENPGPHPGYIGQTFPVPDNVKSLLKRACDDCHSNNTNYPFYTRIQPIHWYVNKHIVIGKDELNLDEFTNHSLRFQFGRFRGFIFQLEKETMPLKSYELLHPEARLTKDERKTLINWAQSLSDQMKATYPMDSLERR